MADVKLCTEGAFPKRDGTGGDEIKIPGAFEALAECIEAVKVQEPEANGVTYSYETDNGDCYAEIGQTTIGEKDNWQNCYLDASPGEYIYKSTQVIIT